MDNPTAFEIEQWRKDAQRLITCTSCYGSGEDRWNEGRACPTCSGSGRSIAEPHVVRLCDEVARLTQALEAAAQRITAMVVEHIDAAADAYHSGAKDMQDMCVQAVERCHDAGVAGTIRSLPVPTMSVL